MVASLRAPHHARPPRPVVSVLLALAGLTLAAGGCANAQEARVKDPGSLFAGKPLEMIVGMPPDGGADAYVRRGPRRSRGSDGTANGARRSMAAAREHPGGKPDHAKV